ncbi:MAG: flagellar protein FlaG [Clostridiaceae bacterium]|nr:flagellar protein FlaG [Clostridiaceae bacterium]
MKLESIQGSQGTQVHAIQRNEQGQLKSQVRGENLQQQMEREQLKKEPKFSQEELVKAVDKANESFKSFERRFEISIHEDTNSIMVKVIDSSTDELIREVPSEKVLDMVAYMMEVAGLFVDTRI